MTIPHDYVERVYAGVLGKLIGVYLGRPFEGWTYDRIMAELGEITYYVHERLGRPLIVTDDDISGTFTFLRALPDYGNTRDLTPAQIGQTWLNYIIERRTILWWGGMGNSTEHTAYLRLKHGIPAPQSGSIALNGQVVAEQIGSQIFIDGWAMVAPGDPELAADFARRAASVSHDGEAIYGAQVIAAMESQAFVERNLNKLLDCGVSFIPKDSVIYRMISDIRDWHEEERDWRKAREFLDRDYGYHKYGGNCHMVPNHGVIIQSLLYGDNDFQKSLMIANTSGWDTDCNSGNVGCLLGIKNGLAGLETGPDWRGPVADRMYLPTADGGRAITDAVSETYRVVNIGRALAGEQPIAPKDGARFHFELPGAVQGFQPEKSVESSGTLALENVAGHSQRGQRSLALHYRHVAPGRVARAATPTFIPPEAIDMSGYALIASPTLYPGQTVRARVAADADDAQPVTCRLFVSAYVEESGMEPHRTSTQPPRPEVEPPLRTIYGPEITLEPGASHEFNWRIEDTDGVPIAAVGVEINAARRASGTVYLDYLTWDGEPDVVLGRPAGGGKMWRQAWVNAISRFDAWWPEPYRLIQNEGMGLLIQGTREWRDYHVRAAVTPHMAASAGIGARVQGLRRYYALLLCRGGKARLVKALDGDTVLAEVDFPWECGNTYDLRMQVSGTHIQGWINGQKIFDVEDTERPLEGGAIALLCEEGRVASDAVTVRPADR